MALTFLKSGPNRLGVDIIKICQTNPHPSLYKPNEPELLTWSNQIYDEIKYFTNRIKSNKWKINEKLKLSKFV